MIKHYLDIFTVEEINKIIKLGDSLVFEKAKIGVGDKPKVRQSEISWIHPPSMAQWMINKIVKIFEQGPLYKAIKIYNILFILKVDIMIGIQIY